jgi:hypothetical protein
MLIGGPSRRAAPYRARRSSALSLPPNADSAARSGAGFRSAPESAKGRVPPSMRALVRADRVRRSGASLHCPTPLDAPAESGVPADRRWRVILFRSEQECGTGQATVPGGRRAWGCVVLNPSPTRRSAGPVGSGLVRNRVTRGRSGPSGSGVGGRGVSPGSRKSTGSRDRSNTTYLSSHR